MFPELTFPRAAASKIVRSTWLDRHRALYEQCRPDLGFDEYVYRSCALSLAMPGLTLVPGAIFLLLPATAGSAPTIAQIVALIFCALLAPALVFWGRMYWISSTKSYRGALIDAGVMYAVGLMLAMASYNVPLKRMFHHLSNMGDVYGQEIALEAAYLLSLIEEDGMDVLSAMRKAQASSPSTLWQELLIGISAAYSSGGNLKEYLRGRYESLAEKRVMDARKYNETVQGASSVYLSVIGIAAIFVAVIDLVFNMAGLMSGNALVWIDALVIVPAGSFTVVKALQAASPEVSP